MPVTKELPKEIVDKDGETWVLQSNGKYEIEAIGRGIGSATEAWIERSIGISARIWRD